MDDPFATEWPDDDLLRIDPHTLFQPEDPNIFSQFPYDAYTTFTDTDSLEGGQTTPPDPGVFDSGYISSNSSDSGKHSPSGSMDSAENSPWVFPPFQNDQGFYQQQGMESEEMTYAPITPKASPIQPTSVRKITPRPAQPTSTTKKYVYIVPKTEPKRFCSPQAAVPGSYVIGSPVYVKAEPAITPIYVKQEQAPIFIAQQPIQALPRKLVLEQPEDESERKLEDRKAKNRAFAQASRLKKKAEIEELKQTITDLQEENGVLREENECLKMRLSRYEFTQTSQPPSRKRAAVAGTLMMAVFMVMAVNPISFDSTPARSVSQVVNTTRVQPTGRVLNADIIQTLPVNASSLTNCASRKFYNSTEAIRLNSDLYDWVDRHETMSLGLKGKHRLLQKKQKDWLSALGSARVNVTETEKNATKVEKKPKDRLWRHLDMISGGTTRRDRARKFLKTDKQDYYSRKAYEKLTAAIQQKEDTLYVLALEDYFLLPALERNFTATPKVTLILPALSHNSTAVGKVPLMRIDLRVVGTGLFQLSRQLLPPQLH